jgi:hypothetical protein
MSFVVFQGGYMRRLKGVQSMLLIGLLSRAIISDFTLESCREKLSLGTLKP